MSAARRANRRAPEYYLSRLPRHIPPAAPFDAAWLIASQHHGRSGSAETWELDQLDAACREARDAFRTFAAPPAIRQTIRATHRDVAWLIALDAAILARCDSCPHVDHFPPDRPIYLDLTFRTAGCEPCFAPAMRHYVNRGAGTETGVPEVEDGVCDLCDTPSESFHGLDGQIGHIIFSAGICGDCRKFRLGTAPPPPPRKARRGRRG